MAGNPFCPRNSKHNFRRQGTAITAPVPYPAKHNHQSKLELAIQKKDVLQSPCEYPEIVFTSAIRHASEREVFSMCIDLLLFLQRI
jgi:hypothetical protein